MLVYLKDFYEICDGDLIQPTGTKQLMAMEKRLWFLVASIMMCMLTATAQDAVSVIRKHYAEAQQKVAEYDLAEKGEGNVFPEYYEINIVQNLPGTGPHYEKVRMYFNVNDNEEWQPDEPMLTRNLQFVTSKYNFAVREYYEEYLYDGEGNVEFIYCRDADMDDGKGGEYRLYFKKGSLFKVLVNILNPETNVYEQKYAGNTMPKEYEQGYNWYMYKAEKFKKLFDEIDQDTFH